MNELRGFICMSSNILLRNFKTFLLFINLYWPHAVQTLWLLLYTQTIIYCPGMSCQDYPSLLIEELSALSCIELSVL